MNTRIYYAKPSISDLELSYAVDATSNGWGDRCYEYIEKFERSFRDYLGVKHAIATSSCTGALHMGMASLGLGPGDEVILADTNWIATAAPILYLGATPVFVDVLPDTWCLDPSGVEKAITPRTRAIVAVHLYGNLCDMDRLLEIGEAYGIPIIEDAAEAIGSVWRKKRAGSMGAFGAFSFHGSKTLTTGEGGMFVTNDDQLYETCLTLSNHGRTASESRQFWPARLGFKYKLSNVQAAIGCAQLERVEELIGEKRRIFKLYQAALQDFPVHLNPEPEGTTNGFWMPTMVVDSNVEFDRQALMSSFKKCNIDARAFFWPLSALPMFSPCSGSAGEISRSLSMRALNLPSYSGLTNVEIDRVVSVISSALIARHL